MDERVSGYEHFTTEDWKNFARRYIEKRLKEDRRDAINELSAYLGDWLRVRMHVSRIFEAERRAEIDDG